MPVSVQLVKFPSVKESTPGSYAGIGPASDTAAKVTSNASSASSARSQRSNRDMLQVVALVGYTFGKGDGLRALIRAGPAVLWIGEMSGLLRGWARERWRW